MLSIDMLPARQGDALWIEWGKRPWRLLIDGGMTSTWEHLRSRIKTLPNDQRHFELLVVSHIDNDHIAGVLPLLAHANELGVTFGDVWFNGYRHLPETPIESLGPVKGERLTTLLLEGDFPWNETFDRRAVVVPTQAGPLPTHELDGGLSVTVLSPRTEQLEALKPIWSVAVTEHGLNPLVPAPPRAPLPSGLESLGATPDVRDLSKRPFSSDAAAPNGTSIALLLELTGGPTAIVSADAFPIVIQHAVTRLLEQGDHRQLALDAFKLPHHGSRGNINCELLELLDCPLYLFSTDGTQTRHPHPESVARVLSTATATVSLAFNYCSEYNAIWRSPTSIARYGYELNCPDEGMAGLSVELGAV